MKILILAQTPPPYHGQSVMQRYLVDAKWNWCSKKFIRLNYSNRPENVGQFSFIKIVKLFIIVLKLWVERLKGKIDILFYPPTSPNRVPFYRDVFTLILTRWCAKKTVFHFHAGGFDVLFNKLNGFEKPIAKKTYRKPDAAIVLSEELQDEIEWINPKRIYIIPNGTRDHYLEDLGNAKKLSEIEILSVGLLSEAKGIIASLEAAALLKERGNIFKWTFLGDWQSWEFKNKVEERILTYGLDNYVIFLGSIHGEEKWKYYRSADIFCLSSYETEAMPLVILEAMMMSLPIVTTNWRAIPELIDDGINGLIVPVKKPKSFAEAIEKLILSRDLRLRLGNKAREKYLKKFTIEKHLLKMESVFKEIAETN